MKKLMARAQKPSPSDPVQYETWRDGYLAGVHAAAVFAGEHDGSTDLPYSLRGIILSKFNLVTKPKRRVYKGISQEAALALLVACREFVRKCDAGEARSSRSYNQMKEAIDKATRF